MYNVIVAFLPVLIKAEPHSQTILEEDRISDSLVAVTIGILERIIKHKTKAIFRGFPNLLQCYFFLQELEVSQIKLLKIPR